VPNATANVIVNKKLADQAKAEERAQMEGLRGSVPPQARPFLGVKGGPELYKQIYGEAKPAAPHYVEGPNGEITSITQGPGGPVAQTVPGAMGKGKPPGPLVSRQDVEKVLTDEGLAPGSPQWNRRFLEYGMQPTAVPDVGLFTRPNAVGPPAAPQPPAPINPNLPAAQQPSVQAAGSQLAGALGNLNAAASGLPGVPSAPPNRVAGAPGGPQPSLAFPQKQQPLPAAEAEKMGTFKTILGMMDRAGQLYQPEWVGPVAGRVGALRQKTGGLPIPGFGAPTAQETEFRSTLQSIANQLLYMRSGAAVTPQEYDRIISELPTPNDPPAVFATKLTTARKILEATQQNRAAEFASRGFRGGEAAPTPAGGAGGGPQIRRFNPATGLLE